MSEELVLVVPRARLLGDDPWHGLRTADAGRHLAVITADGRFAPRAAAEGNPDLKQIIPYLVLRDRERYFLMRRTRGGGDPRLHDRHSIGIGGHLNPGDADVAGGLRREWREEVAASFVPEFRFIGLLNDDTTEVGRVHFGVVHAADALGRPVGVRERDKLEGAFVDPEGVAAVRERLETWSQLVFAFLSGAAAGA